MLSLKFCFEASFLLSRVRESGKTSAREILFGVKVAPYSFTIAPALMTKAQVICARSKENNAVFRFL